MAHNLGLRAGHGEGRATRRGSLPKQAGSGAPWWLLVLPLPVMIVLGALAYPAFRKANEHLT